MSPGYRETLDYLFARLPMFQRIGPVAYKKDLTNTLALLEGCGCPHRSFRSVHIAGTNGKGSVTHLIAASCMQAGLRTGIYTSPHYRDFRERIKIGAGLIPEDSVVAFVHDHRDLIERVGPSFFELTVAMAFHYFAEQQVDIAVIETGLGGRLDSTNVIHPELSVITQIGWDHMDLLGDTLPAIAAEKAGIIKPGVPVVIGETLPETLPVFQAKAEETGSPLILAESQWAVTTARTGWQHMTLEASAADGRRKTLDTDITGPYQVANIRTWLAARDALCRLGLLPEGPGAEEIANVRTLTGFMGRWQVLGERPLVLLDSAHNQDGLESLFNNLEAFSFARKHIVFGMVNDKAPDRLLDCLPADGLYYLARANVPRGMDAEALKGIFDAHRLRGSAWPSVQDAYHAALQAAGPDDLLLVCGSIFVVAEVLPVPA